MELRNARYFLAVAGTLNFTAAGQAKLTHTSSAGAILNEAEDDAGFVGRVAKLRLTAIRS
jgi:DNA-binding transcriptional LysR family regulator